jgi:uncharacterized protein YbcI
MGEVSGPQRPSGEQASAISREVVQAMAELSGRGPTKVRTSMSDDVITVVMRDTFTVAEQTLVDNGSSDEVIELRRAFQHAIAPRLISAVEKITGCRVHAFLSDHHVRPDVAIETFVLAQPGDDRSADPRPQGPERPA